MPFAIDLRDFCLSAYPEKIEYPKDNEFIALLKDKGLYDDLVTINSMKLKSKYSKGELPKKIVNQINAEQSWTVRISKRKGE